MMAKYEEMAERFLDAWNRQEVGDVLACYTPDLIYRDPNTRGAVDGAEAMGRYLEKLFARWRMQWSLRETYALEGVEGAAVLWRATFGTADGAETVETDGMDLVLIEGGKIKRNDVYFDRAVLAPLLATE